MARGGRLVGAVDGAVAAGQGYGMKRLLTVGLVAAVLAGCVVAKPPGTAAVGGGVIGPLEAIRSAATAAPRGVPGVYGFRVQAAGRQDGNIYLNSELDYRDQRNLTVAIRPSAFDGLRARLGGEPDAVLIGREVTVEGEARRVRIRFTSAGSDTGLYYYQTHVDVTRAEQLRVTE